MISDSKTKKLLFIVNIDWFFLSHRLPIAKEALNMRLATLSSNIANGLLLDTRKAGELLAACGDPGVDKAIRNLGDTWQEAGLPPESIEKPWTEEQIKDLISVGGNELLDILDELVNGITRCKIH